MLSNRLPTIASRIFSSLRQSVRPVSSTISDTERIKDYVSHYDTLEVVPGCTKVSIVQGGPKKMYHFYKQKLEALRIQKLLFCWASKFDSKEYS